MNVFRSEYYRRTEGELLKEYVARVVRGITLSFLVLGIPTLALLAVVADTDIPTYIMRRVLGNYLGALIGISAAIYLQQRAFKKKRLDPAAASPPPSRRLRVVTRIVSLMIAGFYLLAEGGWFVAAFMALSGTMGKDVAELFRRLTIVDYLVKTAQVVLIMAAPVALALSRRVTERLFEICVWGSALAFLCLGEWGIDLLAPSASLVLLLPGYGYVRWLQSRGLLH